MQVECIFLGIFWPNFLLMSKIVIVLVLDGIFNLRGKWETF